LVTPAKRGKGVKRTSNDEVRSTVQHHAAMTWGQRLKRVLMGRPSASILKGELAKQALLETDLKISQVAMPALSKCGANPENSMCCGRASA
jgi:hypothetical protein